MDPFKLLSRSTKLNRSTEKNTHHSPQSLPSQGQAINPQLFGRIDHAASSPVAQFGSTQHRKKRKRDRHDSDRPIDLPTDLDFFREKSTVTPESRPAVSTSAGSDSTKGNSRQQNGKIPEGGGDMELLQRRKILNAHKLKITLLSSSGVAEATIESSKKRKKSKSVQHGSTKETTRLYPQPLLKFEHLRADYSISRRLADNLKEQGYNLPTEVQLGSLPLLLKRRGTISSKEGGNEPLQGTDVDLLTIAPTGSGKTIAFLVPVLDGLLRDRKAAKDEAKADAAFPEQNNCQVKALIIAPTKELATQIVNEARKLADGTGIRVASMRKGMQLVSRPGAPNTIDRSPSSSDDDSSPSQVIRSDLLVSTPLILLNSLQAETPHQTLPSIRYLVLDEADVLLDPLFLTQTLGIWSLLTCPRLRVSLWSATISSSIESLALSTILSHRSANLTPENHAIVRLIVGLKDSAVPNISHRLVYTATEAGKLLAIRQLLHPTASSQSDKTPPVRPPFLIFTQTIPRALALHSELLYDIPLQAGGRARLAVLHADLTDHARAEVMARFRRGEVWVLITTDLLARGVDFRGLNAVINYDIPGSSAVYVHRVGRTGRAGRAGGVAVTFYTEEDISCVRDVAAVIAASEKAAGKSAEERSVQPWLLQALPKPTKHQRKELKTRGVEARRSTQQKDTDDRGERPLVKDGMKNTQPAGDRRMRISTKSGFERRIENRKRGAVAGSRARKEKVTGRGDDDGVRRDDEWSGIVD